MLNMRFKEVYHDPFKKEAHKPSRIMAQQMEGTKVHAVEHTYTKKVRSHLTKTQGASFKTKTSVV